MQGCCVVSTQTEEISLISLTQRRDFASACSECRKTTNLPSKLPPCFQNADVHQNERRVPLYQFFLCVKCQHIDRDRAMTQSASLIATISCNAIIRFNYPACSAQSNNNNPIQGLSLRGK